MRRRLEIYVFSAAFCVMSFASPARAQDSGNDDNELTIGVGAAAIPTYDGSDDHDHRVERDLTELTVAEHVDVVVEPVELP